MKAFLLNTVKKANLVRKIRIHRFFKDILVRNPTF